MAENDEMATQWTGHDLFDLDGNKIGTIEDVRYGDVTGGLQWLVVETGILGAKKVFVPTLEVRRAGGRLSVRHTKDRVKNAPDVENEEVLSRPDEVKLCRHYGLQYGTATAEPAEGCEEMKDVRPAG
ncbi:MAG: PRC-barrel domain-containing protein [Actinomycetia bacterium]|nr:PRC-barrel domain-containing protein [Actinomycetes bacterium]